MQEIVKDAPRPEDFSQEELDEMVSQLEEARSAKQTAVLVNQRAMDTHCGKALSNIEQEASQLLCCIGLF